MPLDRFQVAAHLREIAAWIRFRGEKSFRARAYDKGAAAVESAADLEVLAKKSALTSLEGIGASLAAQITDMLETGRSSYLDELRQDLPVGLAHAAETAGISAKKMIAAHEALGIADFAGLVTAAREGKLRDLPGFGEKVATRIAERAEQASAKASGLNLEDTDERLLELLPYLREDHHTTEITVAGERRRALEIIQTIEVVVQTSDPVRTLEHAARYAPISEKLSIDQTSLVARVAGISLRVVAVPTEAHALALLQATGPAEHAARVEELLLDAGASSACADETELYGRAGIAWVPPERRGDPKALEAALDGEDFASLVKPEDVLGMVHCHTTFSDGRNSVLEMARAAEAAGYAYITITDHSPTASYAHGVEIDRLKQQWDEIDEAQAQVKIRILRGTESDITREGGLDYPDSVLEKLDVIVASVHNRYRLDKDQMTERVVSAMRHPCFKVWGHALGRMLQTREPYECHIERILDAVAESRAAIELNGDPHRLDLPPALVPLARERGIKFVLSADAHSTRALGYTQYAVAMARRAGVLRSEILNTRPVDQFIAAVRPSASSS